MKRLVTLLAGLLVFGVVFTIGGRQSQAHYIKMSDLPEECRTLIDAMPIDADISVTWPDDSGVHIQAVV
jgi:hypothetical protein